MLLIGGFLTAAALQPPSYNPLHDTISELAWTGAAHPWMMTAALGATGACCVITAVGLRPARGAGRLLLAVAGVAIMLVAVFRQPRDGYSLAHEVAVIVAAVASCAWPALAARRRQSAVLLTPALGATASGICLGLAAWYALETHRALLGLAERCAAGAPAVWMFAVVITTWRADRNQRRGDSCRGSIRT